MVKIEEELWEHSWSINQEPLSYLFEHYLFICVYYIRQKFNFYYLIYFIFIVMVTSSNVKICDYFKIHLFHSLI